MSEPNPYLPNPFEQALTSLHKQQGVTGTRPAQIRIVPMWALGGVLNYSVTTYRKAGDLDESDPTAKRKPAEFTVFVEIAHRGTNQQIVIPNEVINLVLRHRDQLSIQAQRVAGRLTAAARKAAGWKPVPPRRKVRRASTK